MPIVPIDVDTILVPSLSLMGIDRSGGPTVEQGLRGSGRCFESCRFCMKSQIVTV